MKYTEDGSELISVSKNLKSCEIKIKEGTRIIGTEAFGNCCSLHSVVIPRGVTAIGIRAFENCRSLQKVIIPDSVTEIGCSAFKNCSSLRSVVPPEIKESTFLLKNVTKIGNNAFYGCTSLPETIPPLNRVTEIGDYAFVDTSLKTVYIPNKAAIISDKAFPEDTEIIQY